MRGVARADEARRLLPLLVLCLIVIAVGLSFWFVGAQASRHGDFDWELASIFGTAVGTTLLAVGTGLLAYSTRSEVSATKELADLTREDQANRERPLILLMAVRFEQLQDPRTGIVRIELRNVGLGPALKVRVQATYTGHADWQPDFNPEVEVVPFIEPNQVAESAFLLSGPEPAPEGGILNEFEVSGTYVDRTLGNQERILIHWLED
jgi:hypothetical protein